MTVERNSYGRQLGSFHTTGEVAGVGGDVPMTFIRAPKITHVGKGVDILARVAQSPVVVRQGAQLVVAFHPELDVDLRMHRLFLSL